MNVLFYEVLKSRLECTPNSILVLCKSAGQTTRDLVQYLKDRGIPYYKRYGNRLVVGNLEIGIQYVRGNNNWLECLRGTSWNSYHCPYDVYLSPDQKEFVDSRIRPDYNRYLVRNGQ